jgi:putative CocE/NonD family hydrolase
MQQNDVESRPDVLVYTTPPLEHDLEVTGPLRLILYVSTSATNTDFTGKLVDVYPDGAAYNVSDGILRQAYAAARAHIELDLGSTSLLFFRGHRIRLEVSSSNFPRFDRNPNTGGDVASETRPIPAQQKVYHGADTQSRLILPVVPR